MPPMQALPRRDSSSSMEMPKKPLKKENSDSSPFSMFSGMLIPGWFQDQPEVAPKVTKDHPR